MANFNDCKKGEISHYPYDEIWKRGGITPLISKIGPIWR
jgi:hypothetical protein